MFIFGNHSFHIQYEGPQFMNLIYNDGKKNDKTDTESVKKNNTQNFNNVLLIVHWETYEKQYIWVVWFMSIKHSLKLQ